MEQLKLYLIAFSTFIVADYIWIGVVMKKFYIEQMSGIGRIQQDRFEPIMWAAAIVYLVLAIGVVQFVLPRLSADSTWVDVIKFGAMLGFVVYATYDFTNYSTLKDWTVKLSLVDLAWGTVVTAIASLVVWRFTTFTNLPG